MKAAAAEVVAVNVELVASMVATTVAAEVVAAEVVAVNVELVASMVATTVAAESVAVNVELMASVVATTVSLNMAIHGNCSGSNGRGGSAMVVVMVKLATAPVMAMAIVVASDAVWAVVTVEVAALVEAMAVVR